MILVLSCGLPCAAAAQAGPATSPWHVTASVGPFLEFPEPFEPRYCDQTTWGAVASARYSVSRVLGLEGSLMTAGELGAMTCVLPLRAAPLPGSTFVRTRYREGIREGSLLATGLSLLLELPADDRVSIRGRAGVSRMWLKRLVGWSLGLGSRITLGRHRLVVDVDRLQVDIPFYRELILVGDQGQHLVQESVRSAERATALSVRLGYELAIR